jgi:hypothetical protein
MNQKSSVIQILKSVQRVLTSDMQMLQAASIHKIATTSMGGRVERLSLTRTFEGQVGVNRFSQAHTLGELT